MLRSQPKCLEVVLLVVVDVVAVVLVFVFDVDIFIVSEHGRRNYGSQSYNIVGQDVFFWSIGFLVTPRKRLHGVWTTGRGVICVQSWNIEKFDRFLILDPNRH